MPPILFRNRQPEHAELGHVRDDLERDVAVGQVPFVRVRHDLAVGELAHLLADRLERLVEAAVADRRAVMLAHQRDEARAVLRGVAGRDQLLDRRRHARRRPDRAKGRDRPGAPSRPGSSECRRASARDIRRARCARGAPRSRRSAPRRAHALRIGGKLADRLHIGGEPGEPVRGALLAVEQLGRDAAVLASPWRRPRGLHPPAAPRRRRSPRGAVAIRSAASGRVAASGMKPPVSAADLRTATRSECAAQEAQPAQRCRPGYRPQAFTI